jgi:Flp pilus assembly protein TadD
VSTPAHLLSGDLLFGEAVPAMQPVDILLVDDEMARWVDQVVKAPAVGTRLGRLLSSLAQDGALLVNYNPDVSLTAREMFVRHQGNCLSFSVLFVALAREAGLDARFQIVDTPPSFSSDADFVLLNNHINVHVTERSGLSRVSHVVDFNRLADRGNYHTEVVGDVYAAGLYHGNVAVEALKSGDYRLAFAHLKRGLEDNPRIGGLWVNLGALYSRQGLYQYAEQAYRHALRVEAKNRSALVNLAILADHQGKPDEARKYRHAARRHMEANPYYQQYMAKQALDALNFEEALDYLDKAIALKDDEHQFYHLEGIIHYRSGRSDLAQQSFREASRVAHSPDLKQTYIKKLADLSGNSVDLQTLN